MINIGILSSSLRQRHFQHSNLGGWIDYREISGRGLVRRCRPYMFASLSKLHPSEWEVLGFEAQHGKFPLNRQIHSFRFEMLEQILGSKLSMMQISSCVSTQENNIRSPGKELLQLHSNAFGKIQGPHLPFASWTILFPPPAWKLFLLGSMWMKRRQCLFCDLDSRKSNKESRQQHDVMATRLELEKLGSRCWRQRCYLNPPNPSHPPS